MVSDELHKQLERMRKRHEAIPRSVNAALQPVLQDAAGQSVELMQRFAPVSKDPEHGNPPGALRDSIKFTPGGETTPDHSEPGGSRVVPDNAVLITAGNDRVRYAHFPEYGTVKMAAEPYFWPAVRLLKEQVKARIGKTFAKIVHDEWVRK